MKDQRFFRYFNQAILDQSKLYVAAISGGPDSMALLHVLLELGIKFIAAHFDHGIRKDSMGDRKFVEEYCKGKGIVFVATREGIPAFAKKMKISLETAARERRYQFLYEVAKLNGARGILTGHNANDQAETVLMHIIRGAGINGLAGMDSASYLKQYSEKIPVLRPMLKIPRRLVLEYCAKHSIPFRTDSTNVQTDSTRNRIRLELIPYLEGMNPRIIEQLNRLAATAMKTTEFIESQVANLRDGVVQLEGNCLKVDSDKLADLPFALAAELLRSEVNTLVANAENFTQERLTSLLEKVQNGEKNFRLNLGGNLYAWGSGDILRIGMHEGFDSLYPVLEARAKLKLKLDDTTILNNFWSIESMVTPLVIGQDYKSPDTSAFIDASKVAGDLEIRPVTASDEFVPFGRTSLTNVIEYLKKNQIPAIDARKWPVLCDESGVVWVIGRRLDDRFKITADTKSILRLNLLRQHQALD